MTMTLSPKAWREQAGFRELAGDLIDQELDEVDLEEEITRLMSKLGVEVLPDLDLDPDLQGKALDEEIKALALQLEISTLPEPPYKIPGLKSHLWLKSRALVVGFLLSVLAIGAYFILFETHRPLAGAGQTLVAAGAAFAFVMTVATILGRPGKRRFIAPGIFVGVVIAAIGAWLIWCSKQGFTYVDHGHVLPVIDTTNLWHHFQEDPLVRHGWRKEFEIVLILIGALSVNYNAYSLGRLRSLKRGPNLFDKLEMIARVPNKHDNEWRAKRGLPALSGWQAFSALAFWQFAYAWFFIWVFLRLAVHTLQFTIAAAGPGWARFIEEPITGKLLYIVIGILVSPIARRPIAPVLDDMMRTRAQRFVANDRRIRWWHYITTTPQYREMIRRYQADGVSAANQALARRSRWLDAAGIAAVVIFGAVYIVGWVVKIKYGAS